MTKTEHAAFLLGLVQRQRRFEWQVARDEQTRAAARFVAGKTHDLNNLVQIIQLATSGLAGLCGAPGEIYIGDLDRAAGEASRSLDQLMEVSRPRIAITRGAPVGGAVHAAVEALRPAFAVDIHLTLSAGSATRCTAEELEHVVIGLALDASDGPTEEPERIELSIGERVIDGKPWIEIVRSTMAPLRDDRFELRVVTAIVERAGGELATSERRGGGLELVVGLPVVD